MVSYSKYKDNKKLKKLLIQNKVLRKKTKNLNTAKDNTKRTYLQNENIKKNKITKKRKYTKKGIVYKNNSKNIKSKKIIPLNSIIKGGAIFLKCNIPSIDTAKKTHDELDRKLKNYLDPFHSLMEVFKKVHLIQIKQNYHIQLCLRRKLFNIEQQKKEADPQTISSYNIGLNTIKRDISKVEDIIKKLEIDINKKFKSKIQSKLKNVTKYSNKYESFLNKFTYGSKKSKVILKSSITSKINKIKLIKEIAAQSSVSNKETKLVAKCGESYTKAVKIFEEIENIKGKNLLKLSEVKTEILFIETFFQKSKKKGDDNIKKFENEWKKNTSVFYDKLMVLVPQESLSRLKGLSTAKSLDYSKELKSLQHEITGVHNILKQAGELPLLINIVRELEIVIKWIEGVEKTQKGIIKDLEQLKKDFLNNVSSKYLKAIIGEIINAHLQNTKLLLFSHYYFDNLIEKKTIDLLLQTDTFLETRTDKRLALTNQLGVSQNDQTAFPNRPPVMVGGSISSESTSINDNITQLDKYNTKYKYTKKNLTTLINEIKINVPWNAYVAHNPQTINTNLNKFIIITYSHIILSFLRYRFNSFTPEHKTKETLLDELKQNVGLIDFLEHLTFDPPATANEEKTKVKNHIVTTIKTLITDPNYNGIMDRIYMPIPYKIYDGIDFKMSILNMVIMKSTNDNNDLIFTKISTPGNTNILTLPTLLIHFANLTHGFNFIFSLATIRKELYKTRELLFKSIKNVFEYEHAMNSLHQFWTTKLI